MTKLRGKQEVVASIFLWESNTKVVISDIDGTITRSDTLGQIMPMLGKDWSHSGVTQLYSNIFDNGYQILYLTSRPIGQSQQTRGYLSGLRQEGDRMLPRGPVFTSPDRLLPCFTRELIRRQPHEFKIAALKDIASVFGDGDQRPYYAGFGNRHTDAISYLAVGVPEGKVFTINPLGEISMSNQCSYKKTYAKMNDLVHEMFPPLHKDKTFHEEWNDWNHWKLPTPTVSDYESL